MLAIKNKAEATGCPFYKCAKRSRRNCCETREQQRNQRAILFRRSLTPDLFNGLL